MLKARKLGTILGQAGLNLSAPTLGYPSPNNSNPASIVIGPFGADLISGDVLDLAYSASPSMTSPTVLTHTLSDSDVAGGSITLGLPTGTPGTPIYYQDYITRSGVQSINKSNIVAWGSSTAPTITTSATQSQPELTTMAVALTANKTISAWNLAGGADINQFTISGSTLEWFNNGTQDYSNSLAQDGSENYVVQVTATDLFGNVSAPFTITVTVTSLHKPNSFSLGANQGPPSTPGNTYLAPNLVTISGLGSGISVPWTVTNGTASQNGGAQASSGTCQNGDTLQVQGVAPSTGLLAITLAVSTGANQVSSTWDIITTSTTLDATTKSANATLSNGNLSNTGNRFSGQSTCARATSVAQAAKVRFEVQLTSTNIGTWSSTAPMVMGFDNNTNNFATSNIEPGHDGARPGVDVRIYPTGWEVWSNAVKIANGSATFAIGDYIGLEADSSGQTLKVTHIVSGVETTLATVSSLSTFGSSWWAFTGNFVDTTNTANFKGPWQGTLDTGYVAYGT